MLAAKGQEVPWDLPWPDRQTIGGILATGLAGPRRLGFGMPRDHVLGVTLALADGRTIRPGGRVVKNVAGYDLTRLVVGSRGALGVITEAALRVKPLPEDALAVTAVYATGTALGAALERVHAAKLAPVFLEVRGGWGAYTLAAGVEGLREAVDAQRERLPEALREGTHLNERRGRACGPSWPTRRGHRRRRGWWCGSACPGRGSRRCWSRRGPVAVNAATVRVACSRLAHRPRPGTSEPGRDGGRGTRRLGRPGARRGAGRAGGTTLSGRTRAGHRAAPGPIVGGHGMSPRVHSSPTSPAHGLYPLRLLFLDLPDVVGARRSESPLLHHPRAARGARIPPEV
jgi:hypothetical protein